MATDQVPGGDEPAAEHSGSGGDPVAAELGALFGAALADEPPSSVTPLGVLHQATLADSARRQRRVAVARRWGGGLLAAAAVVGLVVVLGPVLGNRAEPSVAGGRAESAAASSGSAGSAGPANAPDAGASGGSGGAASTPAAGPGVPGTSEGGYVASGGGAESGGEESATPPQPGRGAGSCAASDPCSTPSSARADDGQQPAEVTGSGDSADQSARPSRALGTTATLTGTGMSGCPLFPPLEDAERAAVLDALPDSSVTVEARVSGCAPGLQRASVVRPRWSGAALIVAVQTVGHTPTDTTGAAGSAIAAPGATPVAETVRAVRGGTVVVVTANPQAADHLTTDRLHAIARAVLDATG